MLTNRIFKEAQLRGISTAGKTKRELLRENTLLALDNDIDEVELNEFISILKELFDTEDINKDNVVKYIVRLQPDMIEVGKRTLTEQHLNLLTKLGFFKYTHGEKKI